MKRTLLIVLSLIMISCGSGDRPDVSHIQIDIELKRFEQDFFSIDTNNIVESINRLRQDYPEFLYDYFHNVLGLPLENLEDNRGEIAMAIGHFIRDYHLVKDSSDLLYKNFDKWEKQIKESLRFVKYYYPDYKTPARLITFIGPFDAFFATSFGIQGDVFTREGLGVGLQLHLGENFSFFQSETGQELYPEFISRSFNADHIVVNSMRNVIDDLYPQAHLPSSLIEQMVTSGRKYYLLSKFLPGVKEEMLFGYTSEQMKGTYKNEAVVWDFFLNNDLLNSSDQNIVKNYVGPAPKTQEFGEGSPGNLGSFSGFQIVKKYMQKFPETTLQELMTASPREIYERSKYKPRK